MKKAIFFVIDAIIAASIMLISIILASSFYVNENPTATLNYLSQDLLKVLSEIKIYELDNDYVDYLIANGYITRLNNSVLEQIGELWSERNIEQARNLTYEFLKTFVGKDYDYSVYINDEEIYSKSTADVKTLVSSKKMISGIQKNRSKDGYIARAFAARTKKNNTLIVMGDVITSSVRKPAGANNLNDVNITYPVYIPKDATIIDSYWFIEAAWTDTNFKAYINDEYIPGSAASGSKLLTNLNSYLNLGDNTATIIYSFGGQGYEGGDDGASHFVVDYSSTKVSTLRDINKKYFSQVNSHCSIRYKKPIFIVGIINSMSINMNVVAPTVELKYVLDGVTYSISKKSVIGNNVQWSNSEISNALNSNGHSYSDLNNKYFWFVLDIDEYHSRENKGDERKILPDSYVYIDVTRVLPIFSYGNKLVGDFYKNLEWRFTYENKTSFLMLDSQFAWIYYTGTNPNQKVMSNTYTLYQHPPSPLIVELARFGYIKDYVIPGTNKYQLEFGDEYAVNPFNSLVSITILIPASVTYGATFETLSEATNDAKQRLEDILGEFVSATEIRSDVITLSKVPSMWGPAIIELRVWK